MLRTFLFANFSGGEVKRRLSSLLMMDLDKLLNWKRNMFQTKSQEQAMSLHIVMKTKI